MNRDFFIFIIDKIVKPNSILSKLKTGTGLIVALSFFLTQCVHKPSVVSREPSSGSVAVSEQLVFEQCGSKKLSKKLYLENQMRSMPREYFRLHSGDYEFEKKIPIKCIQFAQSNFVGHYGICNGENREEARPLISQVKPCLTENYVMLAYNAYHDVMDCFSLDPREFYLQIMIESGFHVNAINKTGFDSGISQFTASGIKRVAANNLIEKTRRILLESSRASCQRISSIVGAFEVDSFSVQKRCSMIALPKNPYRAMLFNHLHTMLDQIQLEETLSDLPEIQEALTEKIKRQFAYLAYNRGLAGLKSRLQGYIESRNHFSQIVTENDLNLNKNLSRVKNILNLQPDKRELLKRSRIRNLSFAEYAVIHGAEYVSDMAAAADYVQRYLGNSCGEL